MTIRMHVLLLAGLLTAIVTSFTVARAGSSPAAKDGAPSVRERSFASPIRLHDGDAPINVDIGHAHPLVIDWTGNGTFDLLVGQFGQGKLRLYRNQGTNDSPRFSGFEYVRAGGVDAQIPAG